MESIQELTSRVNALKATHCVFSLTLSLLATFCQGGCRPQESPKARGPNDTSVNGPREGTSAMNASELSSDKTIEVARTLLGLAHVDASNATARRVQLSDQSVPFLRENLRGKSTWRIEFSNLDLAKATGHASLGNQHIKRIVVVLAPDTGHVLWVTSVWPEGVKPIPPYPSAQEEERQLRAKESRYTGLPVEAPKVALFDALLSKDIVFWSKDVKQIHACYVKESSIKYADRPVWVIQFWGFTPFEPPVPPGVDPASIPENARNHIRNVVDAQTGEWLGAGTTPQPSEQDENLAPLEERGIDGKT